MTSNEQTTATRSGLGGIATVDDTFAIVAMDQRNTLKRMYAAVGIADPSLEELTEIKVDTVQALRGSASAFLLDPTYGVPALSELPTAFSRSGCLRSGILSGVSPAIVLRAAARSKTQDFD